MLTPEIITLDLRQGRPGDSRVAWLRGFIARALAAMRELVEAEDEPHDNPLLAEIDQIGGLVGGDTPAEIPSDAGSECLQTVHAVADRMRRRRAERRREMVAIVALVRDAVAAVEVEVSSLYSSIDASTDRFGAISELEDPRQIKDMLVAQVTVLKKVTAERRASWENKQKMFHDRVQVLEQQLQATRREASLDALTGVANRGSFDRECTDRVRAADSRFVMAILDVDDFKGINDTYGHAVGDQVLTAIAQGLRRTLRTEDFIARLGGDEFAVLASNLSLRQAEGRFATAIATLFSRPEGEGEPLPCIPTLSCGLAEFSAGDTYASVYERADQGLYAAKRQGKHRVVGKERAFVRDLIRRQ